MEPKDGHAESSYWAAVGHKDTNFNLESFYWSKNPINLYTTDAGSPELVPQGCTIHTQN